MGSGAKKILPLVHSGLLLAPGFFYALLSLLLASNRILPEKATSTLFLLNVAQLLSFGVTLAKYAADQMILSRLSAGQRAAIHDFFLKRVFPICFFFSCIIAATNGFSVALTLLLCIPVEVYAIIVMLELNISGKFFQAAFLGIIGYPLVFICYTLFSFYFDLTNTGLLLLFVSASFIKLFFAFYIRNKGESKKGVMIFSGYVPLQQAGNYLLFKADQLMIANNLIPSVIFNFSLPLDYLFYAKFVEIYSGIATSLGPLIVKYAGVESKTKLMVGRFFRNKLFLALCLLAVFFQVLFSVLFVKNADALHIQLLLPFCIVTLLIVPVNIINYSFYKNKNLKMSISANLICLAVSAIPILANLYFKSVLVFACIVPLQLVLFVLINIYSKERANV